MICLYTLVYLIKDIINGIIIFLILIALLDIRVFRPVCIATPENIISDGGSGGRITG